MTPQRLRKIKELMKAWEALIEDNDPMGSMLRVIAELIVEVNIFDITPAQKYILAQAYALKNRDYLQFHRSCGGAQSRMIERMCETGLLYGPPYRITLVGRLTHERITRDEKK